MKTKLSLLAAAGVLAGTGAVWLAAHQPPGRPTEPGPVLTLLVGASLLGCGLATWRARPENRVGKIMVLTGFAWFAAQLIEATPAWLNTIGLAVQSVWIIGLVWLLLSFPSGRLQGRLDRWLVVATAALALGVQRLAMLYGNKAGLHCPGCANNLLQVVQDNHKALAWRDLQFLVGAALVATVIALLVVRWLRASTAQRRAVAPVLVAGCATLAALTWTIVEALFGSPFGALPANVYLTLMATVPVAVLFVLLQRRLARGMIAGLVVELGGPSTSVNLREALARALGDPSLQLAFWFPPEKHYVDGDGTPVKLPDQDNERARRSSRATDSRSRCCCTTPRWSTTPSSFSQCARPRASRLRTSASRPSCAPASWSCRHRGRAWCRRRTRSGGGSSATSTTALSSGSSRSR